MPLVHRSLRESLGDPSESPIIIVSGKGGVGKSTISAALAQGLANQGQDIVISDLDGAPSSSDALGGTEKQRKQLEIENEVLEIREQIRVILLNTIIPDVAEEYLEDARAYATELNRLLNALLQNEINGQTTFLPVLRLAMQSLFYGIPTEAKDLAHIVQLMEIILQKRHFVTKTTPGDESITRSYLKPYDHLVIDTENTNNILRMLRVLKRLGRSMQNIHKSVHQSGILGVANTTRLTVRHTPNLNTYAESYVGHHPEEFIEASEQLRQLLFSTKTKLIIITNPGPSEIRKAIADIHTAQKTGRNIDHILMNRWPTDPRLQASSEQIEREFLEKMHTDHGTIGYSRVMPGALEQASPLDKNYTELQLANLLKIAKALGLNEQSSIDK